MIESHHRPYSGVRVIDLSRELGAYAARLFADLGADVIRVESTKQSGSSAESGRTGDAIGKDSWDASYAFLNANKKSVVLDLRKPAGREILLDLVKTSNIVIVEADEETRCLLPEFMALPGHRVITVFSDFGLTGPYSSFVGCDLVDQALGGIAWLCGEPGQAPLRIAGEQSHFVASLYGATATAIAFWDMEIRHATHMLDVSVQECIVHSLQNTLQVYDLEGRVFSRGGLGTRDATEDAFVCQDGYVFLAAPLAVPSSWSGTLQWMKDEGCAGATRLQASDWRDRAKRATEPMKHEFKAIFEKFLVDKTKCDAGAAALKYKIAMAPVSRVSELPLNPQLVFRQYFQKVHDRQLDRDLLFPGPPYRMSEPVWRIERGAPKVGEDTVDVLRQLSVSSAGEAPSRSL